MFGKKENRLRDPILGDGLRKHSMWRDVWHRLCKNPLAMTALVVVVPLEPIAMPVVIVVARSLLLSLLAPTVVCTRG